MGTSMNQRSPRTTNWRAVETAYQTPDITVQRTVQEIWRASANDDKGLANNLGTPIIAQCIDVVRNAQSANDAVQQVNRLIAISGQASLAADIAQRAAVLSFGEDDKTRSFVRSVFAEASNYLISRDIPGYVGVGGKLNTVQDATSLKISIMREVASKVDSVPFSSRNISKPKTWNAFVNNIVNILIGGK